MNQNKLPQILASAGAFGGVFYGMSKNKSMGYTALFAVLFGVAGYYIGSSYNKFFD